MVCCVCYKSLFWVCFWLRERELFVVIVCRDHFCDWFCCWLMWLLLWLFRLIDLIVCFGCFVERLWFGAEEKQKKVGRCVATLLFQALRKNECALIQAVDLLILVGIVCCENAFVFWTSLCEWRKSESFDEPWRILFLHRKNAAICLVLFL